MKRVGFFAIQLALMLVAAGLTSASAKSNRASEKFQKLCALSPGGTVSLQNVNGNVEITTWDKNEVKIEAEKFADDGGDLDDLQIEVDATGDRVAIDTKYPERRDDHHGHALGVNYILVVPRGANLDKIKIVNGEITISGVAGKVMATAVNGTIHTTGLSNGCELETVNGKVDAEFTSLQARAGAKLKSVNGSLVVRLPADAKADIKATATMGHISNEFGLQSSRQDEDHSFVKVGDSLRGKIGGGGASVRLETVNGSIRIVKSGSTH